MTGLLLRLDELPGFDPVGLHVCGGRSLQPWGLVVFSGPGGCMLSGGQDEVPATSLRVSLADPATRDRVARWLAARVGLEVGATATRWGRSRGRAWSLVAVKGRIWRWWEHQTAWTLRGDRHYGCPALASIDLADPQADWLALAAVARHVGSQS